MRKLIFGLLLLVSPACIAQTIVPVVSGTATIDRTIPGGPSYKVNVTSAITFTIKNQPSYEAATITVLFAQDGTGHAVTFDSAVFKNAPTVSTTASALTSVSFQYDGFSNSWAGISGSGSSGIPGGLTTQVQFNNAGVFGGDANFTYATATGLLTHVNPGVFTNAQNNFYNVFSLTGGSACDPGTVITKIAAIQGITQKYTEGASACLNLPAGTGLVTDGQNNGLGGYVINNNSSQQGAYGNSWGTGVWGACYNKANNTSCQGLVSWCLEDVSLTGTTCAGIESGMAPANTGGLYYGFLFSPWGTVQPTNMPAFEVHDNLPTATTLATVGFNSDAASILIQRTFFAPAFHAGSVTSSAGSISQSLQFDSRTTPGNATVTAEMETSDDANNLPNLRFGNTANDSTAATNIATLPDHGTTGVGTGGMITINSCTMSSGTCTYTFANAYPSAPKCVATWNGTGTLSGILKAVPGTSSVVVTSTVGTDNDVVNIICGPAAN